TDDRLRRATLDLHLRDGVGVVESRNLGGPVHTGVTQAIFLLAFSRCSYGWGDMSPGCAISRYLDNPSHQRCNCAASWRRVERARYGSAASRLLRRTRCRRGGTMAVGSGGTARGGEGK